VRAFVKRGVCTDIITHRRSKNTICGRHPIAVLLHAIEISKVAFEIGFTHYASAGPLRTALALPRQLGCSRRVCVCALPSLGLVAPRRREG
jgi:hypothetical protein